MQYCNIPWFGILCDSLNNNSLKNSTVIPLQLLETETMAIWRIQKE